MIQPARVATSSLGRIALLQVGDSIVEHVHPHVHVFLKLGGPDRDFLIDGARYSLTDDTFLLIEPWVPHNSIADGSGSPTEILALYINPSLDAWRAGPWPTGSWMRFGDRQAVLDQELRVIAARVRGRMSGEMVQDQDVSELFSAILSRCISALPALSDGSGGHLVDFRIRRVIGRMRQEPELMLDADKCAHMAGLSRSRYFELFRQSVGVSPRLYVNSLRLETAMERVCQSQTPIKTLAEGLGFSTPGHFTRFFQHHLGSSPRALRRGALQLSNERDG